MFPQPPSALEFITNLVIADGFGYLSHDFTMHVIPILKLILLISTFKNLWSKWTAEPKKWYITKTVIKNKKNRWEFLSKGAQSERTISVTLFWVLSMPADCQKNKTWLFQRWFLQVSQSYNKQLYRNYEQPDIELRNTRFRSPWVIAVFCNDSMQNQH